MRLPNSIGGAYTLESVNADCQSCINMYPRINEAKTQPNGEVAMLLPTPGLTMIDSIGTGVGRGSYTASDGSLYIVIGDGWYKVNSDFTYTLLGTIGTTEGMVSMSDNGPQVCLVDGPSGYIYDGEFKQIHADNFEGATTVSFVDQYFIFTRPDGKTFSLSTLGDGMSGDGLDFASIEGSPDKTLGAMALNRQIYFFGEKTVEVFWNSGNSDFPIERVNGAFVEVGCVSMASVVRLNNSLLFLGSNSQGQGVVFRLTGYQPERVSNHAIEFAIQGYGDLSGAYAWGYQDKGHSFYCLTIPGSATTWCYDETTGYWHERRDWDVDEFIDYRVRCHSFAYNTHVVLDAYSNKVYKLDHTKYTTNGDVLVRERTFPHVANGMKRILWRSLQLDMETGVGTESGQGANPQAMLQVSDDGGHTWSNESWADIGGQIGGIGQYLTRVKWWQLGSSRNRVLRVRITDPIKVVLLGFEADIVTANV